MSRGFYYDEKVVLDLYISELHDNTLSNEEVLKLCRRIAEGDQEAKKVLIENNLKLVPYIAHKYVGCGLSLSDLIQEGNIGLMHACDKFDPSRGVKFGTYACYCISGYIKIALTNYGRIIRVPSNISDELKNYKTIVFNLEMKLGRKPTVEEVAKEMNITIEHARNLCFANYKTVSLEQDFSELENELVATDDVDIDNFEIQNIKPLVYELLVDAGLSDMEIQMLMLRFQDDENPKTFKEIGEIFGYTRQGVQHKLLSCLKRIRMSKKIHDFLELMDNPSQSQRNLEEYQMSYVRKRNKK